MDFTYTEIQTMLADSVGKFIDNEYDFDTRQAYAASDKGYSEEVWSTFAELGWTAVPFSEDDGGFGGGPTDVMVLMQSLAPGLVVEPYLANIILAGGILRRAASPDQKARWLQAIIGGELQATLAFTEPQARYDLASVHTTATQDGDSWVLNGTKGLVPNGGTADLLIVPARTGGATVDEDGITLFAIDANAEGVSCNAYSTVDGLRAAEITLDGVRAGADAVIGGVGRGFAAVV